MINKMCGSLISTEKFKMPWLGWLARYDVGTVWFNFYSLVSLLSLHGERLEGYVRCCRWDHPFYLPYLLTLNTSCRADCCVTTLVPTGSILLVMPLFYLCDEPIGVLTPLLPSILPFVVVIVLEICAEKLVVETPLLSTIFSFFVVVVLFFLWRADWCVDAAVTVSFSYIFL